MAKRQKPWFRKVRWSYIGNTWQGFLCYIPYIFVLITSLVYSISSSKTFPEAIFKLFPIWITATIVMQWFASNESK